LIDNSVYTALARAFAGKPAALDDAPVPRRNILTLAGRFNKQALLDLIPDKDWPTADSLAELGLGARDLEGLDGRKLLTEGLGDQFAVHLYDSEPAFDFDAASLLGFALGSERDVQGLAAAMQVAVPATLLSAPVYFSLPVRDATVVDAFGDAL